MNNRTREWGVAGRELGFVALGGAVGACARYWLGLALSHGVASSSLATVLVNLSGCFLIGILMAVLAQSRPLWRFARPFLGVGVLGGYTTFSTHVLDILAMVSEGAEIVALVYLGVTLLGGLLAVWSGVALTEFIMSRRDR